MELKSLTIKKTNYMTNIDKVLRCVNVHVLMWHTGATIDDICTLEKLNESEANDAIKELLNKGIIEAKESKLYEGEIKYYPIVNTQSTN
jgi:predicted transcriptional regulator